MSKCFSSALISCCLSRSLHLTWVSVIVTSLGFIAPFNSLSIPQATSNPIIFLKEKSVHGTPLLPVNPIASHCFRKISKLLHPAYLDLPFPPIHPQICSPFILDCFLFLDESSSASMLLSAWNFSDIFTFWNTFSLCLAESYSCFKVSS